jgi:Zn-finger nucleic acid-binding protein
MAPQTKACPVCDRPAQWASPKLGDLEQVACPECGKFQVSGSALKLMETKRSDQRRAYLLDAKNRTRPGEFPFIRDILR